jgi:hypothetical protein
MYMPVSCSQYLVLVHGNNSEIFRKYFGNGPTSPPVGWFSKVVSGNKAGVIFRCDDPDRNCATQNSKQDLITS